MNKLAEHAATFTGKMEGVMSRQRRAVGNAKKRKELQRRLDMHAYTKAFGRGELTRTPSKLSKHKNLPPKALQQAIDLVGMEFDRYPPK